MGHSAEPRESAIEMDALLQHSVRSAKLSIPNSQFPIPNSQFPIPNH
ncbi:hypothetical protein [Microcoleus sp.]